MAKKTSARSKGYRTYHKKPEARQWTDAEKQRAKWIAIAAAALIVVIVVAVMIVRNVGVLKVRNGVVQNTEETWVLRNTGTNSKPRVYRIASSEPIDGFTLQTPDRTVSQGLYNTYKAVDESAVPSTYTLGGATGAYDEVSQTVLERMASDDESIQLVKGETAGRKTAYFIRSYNVGDPEEEGAEVEYYQYLYGYVDAKLKGYSVMVLIGGQVADESAYQPDEALAAMFEEIVKNTTIG